MVMAKRGAGHASYRCMLPIRGGREKAGRGQSDLGCAGRGGSANLTTSVIDLQPELNTDARIDLGHA